MDRTRKDKTTESASQVPELINTEAERAVLGRLLIDDRQWWNVSDKLKPEDFGHRGHANIFSAMEQLVAVGRSVTISTVLAQSGETRTYDKISSSLYLNGLFAGATEKEIADIPLQQFVDVILHRSGCRQLVAAAETIKNEASLAPLSTPLEDLRQSANKLLSISDTSDSTEDEKIGAVVSCVILDTEETRRSGKSPGIKTGFSSFDELVGPLLPGNLIVLAGETGSGKTALATQLGLGFADQGIGVRMTSLEMEAKEIATRVLATYSDIEAEKILEGNVTSFDLDRMMQSGQRVLDIPFWIDARPRQSSATIQARLARAQAKYGIRVGFVDHLQYVLGDSKRHDERERIAQVVDDHKAIAKRLGIVLFLISHVSRQVDFSSINTLADVKRPTLNSLYGSSAIEKAADATVFVHRPAWFLERATPVERHKVQWKIDLAEWEGKAELVLPKRRNGKGFGIRTCYFNEKLTWFTSQPPPLELVH